MIKHKKSCHVIVFNKNIIFDQKNNTVYYILTTSFFFYVFTVMM